VSSTRETHAAFDRFVRWTIERELAAATGFLPPEQARIFADYYRGLPREEAVLRRYLRGMWRSEAGWAARWLARRSGREPQRPAVLDAGSGFGTYSMLFATVGADATGVDLRPDRLEAAEHRLRFHAADSGAPLPVRYLRADLTRDWDREYDMVWVYNALSHIDPLDRFLGAVRDHLRPGGVLVVGDINGAHPAHVRRLAGLRTEVHQEYVAPDGQRHAYAVERTFPPRELRQEVQATGFRVVRHELYWGGLGRAPEPLYAGILKPLQKQWWLGQQVARRQLLVATPVRS
jgi:2-polyprenyl-3-methyl-5-hydroxy-6-metoxy-1,4-benzoquinol methylase